MPSWSPPAPPTPRPLRPDPATSFAPAPTRWRRSPSTPAATSGGRLAVRAHDQRRSAAPTGLAILPADDTAGPGTTAIHAPRLTGAAVPNILVQVYENAGTDKAVLVAAGNANPAGTFTLPTSPALAPGTYTLGAVEVSIVNGKATYGAIGSPFLLTITPPPSRRPA